MSKQTLQLSQKSSASLADPFLGKFVTVKTVDHHVTVSGILIGVDRGCHGGLGNFILKAAWGLMVIRGDSVAVVAGL